MKLVPVDPDDDAAVAAYVAVARACAAVDAAWERPLTPHRQVQELRTGYEGEGGRGYLLRDGERDVGTAELYTSEYDNRSMAWIGVQVLPELRRRGLASTALESVYDECRRLGRDLVLLWGWDTPAMRAFASGAGFVERSVEVCRVLEVDTGPERAAYVADLHAEAAAHAGEYDLETVTGPSPEPLLAALLAVTEAINDAPTDDLEIEDEAYDLDRIRAYEQAQQDSGFRMHRVLARHRATGEVVGHTVVAVDAEQPRWAEQHDTAVVPAHRGHRLGMLLKTAMLQHLAAAEPQLRRIVTENAESNAVMVEINERLGLTIADRVLLFQRRI